MKMKKVMLPILALFLAVGVVLAVGASAAAGPVGNLLENPGAEELPELTEWDHSPGIEALSAITESCGQVNPNSGARFFAMGFDGHASPVWMEQTIDLTGYGGTPETFTAGGFVQTEMYWMPEDGWPGSGDPGYYDCGGLVVEFFDGGGGSIGTFELEPEDPGAGNYTGAVENPCCEEDPINIPHTYAEFAIAGDVPEGAETVVYRLKGYRVWSVYINTFYDDLFFNLNVSVQPTPTPTPTPTPAPPPVGGTILPTDKLGLMMPWVIGAGALIVVVGLSLAAYHRRYGAEKPRHG